MGVFRHTLSSRRARRAFEVKKYINCHFIIFFSLDETLLPWLGSFRAL